MRIVLSLTVVSVVLLLAACGAREEEVPPTPTRIAPITVGEPAQEPTATPVEVETAVPAAEEAPPEPIAAEEEVEHEEDEAVAEGYSLYLAAGCAACHGQDGSGGIGPALAGHTREQVFRQVRSPKGDIMPAYPPDRLSDEELEKIVAWIDSLGEDMAMEHDEGPEFELTMTEAAHLRLILDSIAAENQTNAIHHAQHLVDDAAPEILPVAQKLLDDLQAGELHDVEKEATEILDAKVTEDFDFIGVHLGMALQAIQRDDLRDAEHHMESAVQVAAGHDHQEELQRLAEALRAREDLHGVRDSLLEQLGLEHTPHNGTP